MSLRVHPVSDEQQFLEFIPAGTGFSSARAAIFNLRRNDYFSNAGSNGSEPELSRTGIAKQHAKPPRDSGSRNHGDSADPRS